MRRIAIDDPKAVMPIPESGCFVWMGSLHEKGYAQTTINGRGLRVHRIVWERAHGPVPTGFVIDHICRVRSCINVHHLRAVTNKFNILIGEGATAINARKTKCINGHPFEGDNLVVRKIGRGCRICINHTKRWKYHARKLNGLEDLPT